MSTAKDAAPPPYGLPEQALQRLLETLYRNPTVDRVVLYGSRAKGNYRPGSDIDLCLFAPAMTLPELLRLGVDIDELLLPWKVDLSLWHQIDNPGLRAHIERVGRDLISMFNGVRVD
jgi:predicted nucleotidyltransferase